MKIEKMGLNPNKNEVKKEREAKNNFAMSKFGLPKMQNGNLKKRYCEFWKSRGISGGYKT
ncbi:MAG: hypothetical protein L6V95_02935 [Candidatus Melainabacteria bacterium]|nr:MAG: hypothetical protein L6V95_02935 [Candidatus Melainabacteria bacterium]